MNTSRPATINVLGTRIAATHPTGAIATIAQMLAVRPAGKYICVAGVHGVMEGMRSAAIQSALNGAAMCVPDGVPLTWVGRLRGHRDMARVYGPDLMLRLIEWSADKRHSHYFFGGEEGVAAALAGEMQRRFPTLSVAGCDCPPFRPLTDEEIETTVARINASGANILWIGISTPKQDLLMARLAQAGIQTGVMLGVGAAFDFHTGRLRQAPSWIQRIGMEWCFRLCMEPRRLAARYLRNNPAFLFHIFLQSTRLRTYPLPSPSDPDIR